MKKRWLAAVLVVLACFLSGWAGYAAARSEARQAREARCRILTDFAAGHIADWKDGRDHADLEAAISNLYAAYECRLEDDPALSNALHELWNALIFAGEGLPGNEDTLIAALESGGADVIGGAADTVRNAA